MIPLSVPNLSGNEWKYIKECLDTNWVSSVGSYVTLFEKKVAEFCGVGHAVATSNGTAALHISLLLAGVKPGDLVLLPDITFVAPANSIKYAGAEPVLIDVDPQTWQMDLDLVKEFLDKETSFSGGAEGAVGAGGTEGTGEAGRSCIHTKSGRRVAAIMPVHVLGNMCDMETLLQLAERYGLAVIEDSTEALGSYYKGKHAGTFGRFGCLSFNGNKIITTGGGGMIFTDDPELAARAKHITTQSKSDPAEYYHDEVGYNYRLVNILAAMGVAQMEQLPAFLLRKKEIRKLYAEGLRGIGAIKEQVVRDEVDPNYWLYTVKAPDQRELRKFLKTTEIEARPLWVPMHALPAFKDCMYINKRDVSNEIYKICISLPCSSGITDEEISMVITQINAFYRK